MPRRVYISKRNPPRLVPVRMTCGHERMFNVKIKPRSGEPLWCERCADYKDVA